MKKNYERLSRLKTAKIRKLNHELSHAERTIIKQKEYIKILKRKIEVHESIDTIWPRKLDINLEN